MALINPAVGDALSDMLYCLGAMQVRYIIEFIEQRCIVILLMLTVHRGIGVLSYCVWISSTLQSFLVNFAD